MSDKIQPATDEFVDRIRMKPTPVEERLIARLDAERAEKEALRAAVVGGFTNVGIFMPVDRDPASPAEVRAAIRRLAAERDAERARAEKAEKRADDATAYAHGIAAGAGCSEIRAAGGARCGACRDCFAEELARAEKAEAQNARMREVLTDKNVYRERDGICCVCMGDCVDEVEYHAPDCIVAELLREK